MKDKLKVNSKNRQLNMFSDQDQRKEGWNEAIDKIIEIAEVYDVFGLTISDIKNELENLKK